MEATISGFFYNLINPIKIKTNPENIAKHLSESLILLLAEYAIILPQFINIVWNNAAKSG